MGKKLKVDDDLGNGWVVVARSNPNLKYDPDGLLKSDVRDLSDPPKCPMSHSSCAKCEGKKGVPEPGLNHCIVCISEYIEQERLKKLPGYKFFLVLDMFTSIIWWGFFFGALYAAGQHWAATFLMYSMVCVVVYLLRLPIIRRTKAEHSLAYQDKKAASK